jgi:hypothetical protein
MTATKRRIRTDRVVDCPKEKRVVPVSALAAGANRTQLTCRRCPCYQKETCSYVTCQYNDVQVA